MVYLVGSRVKATASFTDDTGAPLDPTTVVARIRKPDGERVQYTYGVDGGISKPAVGTYLVEVDLDQDGAWYVRVESDGVGKAAVESEILVRESRI